MQFWPRILVLLLSALPAYIIGTVLVGVFSAWIVDFNDCYPATKQLCRSFQAVEIMTIILSSFAT
jgi:hypothetical protein